MTYFNDMIDQWWWDQAEWPGADCSERVNALAYHCVDLFNF
tara:strand:- start:1044 stop:1166 length:123 start_codon:yes stop_codon:yes gene_type:complete